MLTVFRRHQQILMLVIAIMTIIAFIWLYNRTNLTQVGSNDVARIYGQVVQRAEIDRQARGYQLAMALGLTDFVRDLGGLGENEESSASDFILNLLIIQHQAPELGIRPSDEAVAEVIKSLPLLQTNGAFDPAKYSRFLQEQLVPRGFTERQMEDTVRDSLRVKMIRSVVTSPIAVGESQVREAARIYQAVDAQILRFDRSAFEKSAAPTKEEISAFYEKNKAGLRSNESRSISYLLFTLPETQQKLVGKDHAAALQKLADQAVETLKSIRQSLAKGMDLSKAAEAVALHAQKAQNLQSDGSQNGKPSGLPEVLVAATYRLQKTGKLSEIIQDGNSFYALMVDGVAPARQLEFTEVADKIGSLISQQKAASIASDAATKSLDKIRAAMVAGKSFSVAAKEAGVKTQVLSGVVPADEKNSAETRALVSATLSLKAGELGSLQGAPWGNFAIYLEKRAPLSDALWKEHQPIISKTLLSNEQSMLFLEWLRAARVGAQVKMLPGAAKGGG
jgi:hypothetical protein